MNKVNLIIQREYLSRVKKKSFIIMSIVGPLLIAAIMIVPAWLATSSEDYQNIEVLDETGLFIRNLENTEEIKFNYEFRSLEQAQKDLNEGGKYTAILHIPKVVITHPKTVQIFYKEKPKGSSISYMETQIAKVIENKKLEDLHNLSLDQISGLRPNVQIVPNKVTSDGKSEETADGVASLLGYFLAFFIYLFIFLFGVQVMRGVIEEKSNRIVEVIISSVKPFQLMMGKILGIALVAITQFLIWVVLSTAIIGGAQQFFKEELKAAQTEQVKKMESVTPSDSKSSESSDQSSEFIARLSGQLSMINFPLVLGAFLFYFIGGYLLYGSLFAAIGSAVDNETDTQQFMVPVTIPLILAIAMAQVAIENPDGTLAFWGSMIPFTSPIIMMIRIPVGVAYWEIILSMGLLIATFIASTWVAGKIYRTGILMYGKKVTFKELGKWLIHKS
ncbi:MAG: ABC transporter permease [Flavobacteriales bacterium]|nr:ABC transporter permease [Flavobacteriales bacterium]|tara:strand:- start:1668 stop:3005 length:1338 start_codon:yes stop_codon:yes gene_type:complete